MPIDVDPTTRTDQPDVSTFDNSVLPAHPVPLRIDEAYERYEAWHGLTKRERIATDLLAAMLASDRGQENGKDRLTKIAVAYADNLLNELGAPDSPF